MTGEALFIISVCWCFVSSPSLSHTKPVIAPCWLQEPLLSLLPRTCVESLAATSSRIISFNLFIIVVWIIHLELVMVCTLQPTWPQYSFNEYEIHYEDWNTNVPTWRIIYSPDNFTKVVLVCWSAHTQYDLTMHVCLSSEDKSWIQPMKMKVRTS